MKRVFKTTGSHPTSNSEVLRHGGEHIESRKGRPKVSRGRTKNQPNGSCTDRLKHRAKRKAIAERGGKKC